MSITGDNIVSPSSLQKEQVLLEERNNNEINIESCVAISLMQEIKKNIMIRFKQLTQAPQSLLNLKDDYSCNHNSKVSVDYSLLKSNY